MVNILLDPRPAKAELVQKYGFEWIELCRKS